MVPRTRGGPAGLRGPLRIPTRRPGLPEAPDGVDVVTRVRIPAQFNVREARSRNDLAASLRNALADLRRRYGSLDWYFQRAGLGDDTLDALRAELLTGQWVSQ